MKYKDSWKNKEVFQRQLNLNKKELSGLFPEHWEIFLEYVKEINPSTILDIGCGVGTYYILIKNNYPLIEYTGIDYAEEAIEIAKSEWKYDSFYQKDLWELDKAFISEFDLVHLGALLDVLPNGNDALAFILSLNPKNVLIGRMEITDSSNIVEEYVAYNLINTYKYKHNWNTVLKIIKNNNYEYSFYKNNLYLKKII